MESSRVLKGSSWIRWLFQIAKSANITHRSAQLWLLMQMDEYMLGERMIVGNLAWEIAATASFLLNCRA